MSQREMQVENFLDTVCAQIRCKKAHESLRKELADHIADQAEHNVASGQDEETATKEAIIAMGDPILVGGQLDSVHRPKPKWSVILIAILFILIGAGMRTGIDELNMTFAKWISLFPMEVLKTLPIGVISLAFGYFLDYTKIAKYVVWIYPIMLGLTIVSMTTLPQINGRTAYISYFILLFIPVYSAVIYRFKGKGYLGLLLCGVCFVPIMIVTMLILHLSVLCLIATVCLAILTVAILKGWFAIRRWVGLLIVYVPILCLFLFAFLVKGDYLMRRLTEIILPTNRDSAYWNCTLRNFLLDSQWIGSSVAKESYFSTLPPHATSYFNRNFRISALITDFGFIAGIIVLLTMAVLLFFLFRNVLKTKNQLGLFVSLGVTLVFVIQSFTYFCASFGLIFFSQYELPLLADGKISTVIHLFLLGIVLSVFKYQNILKTTEAPATASQNRWIIRTGEGILIKTKQK